jgi:hypothetical protein
LAGVVVKVGGRNAIYLDPSLATPVDQLTATTEGGGALFQNLSPGEHAGQLQASAGGRLSCTNPRTGDTAEGDTVEFTVPAVRGMVSTFPLQCRFVP